jgi:hypothetical protein
MRHPAPRQWRRVLGWFRGCGALDEATEQFLASSRDLAELERRLRALERGFIRVIPVTFNH